MLGGQEKRAYKTLGRSSAEDLACLEHLNHESASVMKEVIFSPNPGKHSVHYSNVSSFSRHKGAALRENCD